MCRLMRPNRLPEREKQLKPCRGVMPCYALPSCAKGFLHTLVRGDSQ